MSVPGATGSEPAGAVDQEPLGEVPADLVRVVRGQVSDDELAALVAGIVASRASQAADDGEQGPAPVSAWADRAGRLGLSPRPGPDAWRWSARRRR